MYISILWYSTKKDITVNQNNIHQNNTILTITCVFIYKKALIGLDASMILYYINIMSFSSNACLWLIYCLEVGRWKHQKSLSVRNHCYCDFFISKSHHQRKNFVWLHSLTHVLCRMYRFSVNADYHILVEQASATKQIAICEMLLYSSLLFLYCEC